MDLAMRSRCTIFAEVRFFAGNCATLLFQKQRFARIVVSLSLNLAKPMNSIDLIVSVVALLAVWNGWRQGVVVQLFSLAGIVAGIYLASRYGAVAGELLRLDPQIAAPAGFVVVLLLTILLVAVAARLVRKLFHFAGFGVADIVLGVVVSLLKYALVLSVLFSAFDTLNADYTLIKPETVERSKLYKPVMRFSGLLFPFLEWVERRIPQQEEPEE